MISSISRGVTTNDRNDGRFRLDGFFEIAGYDRLGNYRADIAGVDSVIDFPGTFVAFWRYIQVALDDYFGAVQVARR